MTGPGEVVAAFTIPGEPVSKARARFTQKGVVYTTSQNRSAERMVQVAFWAAAPTHQIAETDLFGVAAVFFAGTRQRRDVDNMLKLVLDGLNRVAWRDDVQVLEVSGKKRFVPNRADARTEVVVYRVAEPEAMRRILTCENCGNEFDSYPSWHDRRFCGIDCWRAFASDARRKVCPGCDQRFLPTNSKQVYCTLACNQATRTVIQSCTRCGNEFRRPKSWSTNGNPFCSSECRCAYWRDHRSVAARGVCADCGGHTSKKTYTRCRACAIARVTRSADQ
jgi:Holliday junction resolvase RusA-like endonuclease